LSTTKKTFRIFWQLWKKWEFCLASLGIFFLPNFFSEMRSWLLGFSGPSITGWAYSTTGFTLVLTGRVSVCNPFLWAKVLQNPPVLPACRLPRCRFRLPCCPAAAACAACRLNPCRLPSCPCPACRSIACRLPLSCRLPCRYAFPLACRIAAACLPLCFAVLGVRLPIMAP